MFIFLYFFKIKTSVKLSFNPLTAVLSAISALALAAHCYVPLELHFVLYSAVWNRNLQIICEAVVCSYH